VWKSTRTNGVDDAPSRIAEAPPRLTDYSRPALRRPSRARRLRTLALAETSAAFTASGPSTQQVFQVMARRLANRVDGGCLIRPRPDAICAVPTAAAHARLQARPPLMALMQASPNALVSAYCAWVTERGRSMLTADVSPKALRLWTAEAAWPYLDACDISSFLVVPLRSAEQIVGTVALWRERPGRKLDEDDQLFAEEVGRRLVPSAGPDHT
jgi:GAF domain-containing protein